MLFKKSVLLEVSYFPRNICNRDSSLGSCDIEDLFFLENNIVLYWNPPVVQSTDSSLGLYIFIFEVLFLTGFCTSFWKRVHNSKEIVNLQDLFVLTVRHVGIKTSPNRYYSGFDLSDRDSWFTTRFWIFTIEFFVIMILLHDKTKR